MAATFVNCSNVTEVKIKVKTGSDIDVNKYKEIAVLPFVADNKLIKEGKKDFSKNESNEDKGEKISFFMRRALSKNKEIDVMDTVKTNSIIAGESIDKSLLEDENRLADIGGELGVNAIIIGRYRFYSISEPRTIPVSVYSQRLHRYITETVTYFHKTYILSLHVIVVDAHTGKPVLKKLIEPPPASEPHSLGTLIIEAFQDDRIFEKLVNKAVSDFAKRITPHYELEKRMLVK